MDASRFHAATLRAGWCNLSASARDYVKKLNKAPDGQAITLGEKALLWYLADSYNDDPAIRAAWPAIDTLAKDNGMSAGRVRQILSDLIGKRIVWRDHRPRKDGRSVTTHSKKGSKVFPIKTNLWRFNALDGDPPEEVLEYEKREKARGKLIAEETHKKLKTKKCSTNKVSEYPQFSCATGSDASDPEAHEVMSQRLMKL